MVLKRKQDEKDKIKEYKIMKIDPKDENGEEKLRSRKEIWRIDKF